MKDLTSKLGTIDGGRILDVATGAGSFVLTLDHLLKSYDEVLGIDSSNRAIHAGQNKFKDNSKVDFKKMDAAKMEFEPNSFDTVTISNSMHHFNNVQEILQNMMRVLKPGGYFLISEMCQDDGQTEAQQNHIKIHHWWAKVDSCFGTVHNPTYTTSQMQNLISNLPFKELNKFSYSYPMENPKDDKMLSHYINTMDPYINPLKDKPEYASLKKESEALKQQIREHGFAPAKTVFFIGRKPL